MTNDQEFPKQNNQPMVEQPNPQETPVDNRQAQQQGKQETNPKEIWNTIGLITAGVGAAFFYLVGWTYISNWYSFFGISIYQIDLPTYHILVNSVPLILLPLVSFIIAVIIDHIFGKLRKEGTNSFNIRRVMGIYLFLILIIIVSYIIRSCLNNPSFSIKNIPEELYWFGTVILFTSILFFKRGENKPSNGNDRTIVVSFIAICILISSVSIAALAGIADAAVGRQGSWQIPQAYITSSDSIPVLNDYPNDSAPSGTNKYGPFGLIEENDHTIYLVPWRKQGMEYFTPLPRLFILPRNESTILYISTP
jgi:hypothetical protein